MTPAGLMNCVFAVPERGFSHMEPLTPLRDCNYKMRILEDENSWRNRRIVSQ